MTMELEAATREAEQARLKLATTARELQDHLSPTRILDHAVNGAATGAASLLETVERTASRRPKAVRYAGLAIALLVARKPIGRLAGRLFRRRKRATGE